MDLDGRPDFFLIGWNDFFGEEAKMRRSDWGGPATSVRECLSRLSAWAHRLFTDRAFFILLVIALFASVIGLGAGIIVRIACPDLRELCLAAILCGGIVLMLLLGGFQASLFNSYSLEYKAQTDALVRLISDFGTIVGVSDADFEHLRTYPCGYFSRLEEAAYSQLTGDREWAASLTEEEKHDIVRIASSLFAAFSIERQEGRASFDAFAEEADLCGSIAAYRAGVPVDDILVGLPKVGWGIMGPVVWASE